MKFIKNIVRLCDFNVEHFFRAFKMSTLESHRQNNPIVCFSFDFNIVRFKWKIQPEKYINVINLKCHI